LEDKLVQDILEKVEKAGWAATRAFLQVPAGDPSQEEIAVIEDAMRSLAKEGKVTLWRLVYTHEPFEFMVAAKPDMELDKELEQREAWATAHRLEEE
jgi:hypothetical protein